MQIDRARIDSPRRSGQTERKFDRHDDETRHARVPGPAREWSAPPESFPNLEPRPMAMSRKRLREDSAMFAGCDMPGCGAGREGTAAMVRFWSSTLRVSCCRAAWRACCDEHSRTYVLVARHRRVLPFSFFGQPRRATARGEGKEQKGCSIVAAFERAVDEHSAGAAAAHANACCLAL